MTSYGLGIKSVYRRTTIQLAERSGLCTLRHSEYPYCQLAFCQVLINEYCIVLYCNKKRDIDPSRLLRMSVMVSVAMAQVGMTELIFVNPGMKVNGQYYCDVLLSPQMLPAIKHAAERCLFTKQYVAYGEIGHFFVICDFPR